MIKKRDLLFVSVILASAYCYGIACAAPSTQAYPASGLTITTTVTEEYKEIAGNDDGLGVHFTAREKGGRVVINAELSTKKLIHAEIDYNLGKVQIRSLSTANGQPIAIENDDIIVFQNLLVLVPQKINTASKLGDALMSFLNLMSSAPSGGVLDIK